MNSGAGIIAAVLLLLGNAFFVAAEFSLISARRSAIELKAREGSRAARLTIRGMERLSLMLAGAQLGVTLCSLGLGALGEPVIAHLLEGPFHMVHLPDALIHPISFLIALGVMTYLHVVIGEMVPKNITLANPDRSALVLTPILSGLVRLLYPAVIGLNALANLCLRLIHVKPQDEVASTFTSDEVAGFVEESHREGLISEGEEHLLSGALRFDERSINSVLIPLDQLVYASPHDTPAAIEKLCGQTGFSRFPVRGGRGKLYGYVHLKDVLDADRTARTKPLPKHDIRPLETIASTATLRSALTAMQRSGSHLAQVVTSRGRVLGIVALEDLLEELVGEISDVAQKVRATA